MPSPDDEAIDRLKNSEGANGMIIYSFVRFERMKKKYWTVFSYNLDQVSDLVDLH
jgi:hypothetical protein